MQAMNYSYEIMKNGEVIRHVCPLMAYASMRESVGYFTGKVTNKGEDIAVKDAWPVYIGDKNLTVCLRGTELLVLKNARFAGHKETLVSLVPDSTRLVEHFTMGGVTFKAKRYRVLGKYQYQLTFKLQDDFYKIVIAY